MSSSEHDEFDQIWKDLYIWTKMLTSELSANNIKLDKYSYWLYDRSLYLLDAFIPIHQQKNNTVQMILVRSLFEIKIKASLYQDNPNKAINMANKAIVDDIKKFIRLAKKGDSFTSQTLREKLDLDKISIGKPEKRSETIKSSAHDADLNFEYEIFYWLTSMFVHSTPLSFLLLDEKESQRLEVLSILNKFASDTKLISLMFVSSLIWITEYLFGHILPPNCQEFMSHLEKSMSNLFKIVTGFEHISDTDIPIGEIHFVSEIGQTSRLTRKQRK